MSPTLSIDVSLELETDGTSFSIWSEDNRIILNAPSFRSLSRLRTALDRLRPLFVQAVPPGRDPAAVLPPIELQVRRAPIVRLNGLPADSALRSVIRDENVTVLPIGIFKATLRRLG
ncbi:hypothetical protein [Halalkalirubrum salinum]|uniref:hypothetical protein n=1 Tax=Halalkalirubrum salinum TaxID=2563889 RepID=UPI0010FB6888|nr:hypothetical protein [Halalkalirubrum salinum]